jgi:dephospho-CoA kinase
MLIVGLTGGIGCGKSLVSDLFHEYFTVPIIDADIIARELTQTNTVIELISQQLGTGYINEDGLLLREKLRQVIFSDSSIRAKFESILHPLVYDDIRKKLSELHANYCIVVIPLLLETKRTDFLDRILVVDCTIEEQISRVVHRDQCSESHVEKIINAQIDRNSRLSLADDIITNSENASLAKEKVALLHQKYTELSKPHNEP